MVPWHTYLCEYYNITPKQAGELSARKWGRKPDLPKSATTHAVSGMTLDDVWTSRPRNSNKDIHQFYKDCGAWMSIRQARHNIGHYAKGHLEFIADYVKEEALICVG